ncbi:MAG TPA: NAD(P)-binding domain-containing protein, partial [Kofleriaceae bacterium]|nr:NAD(P)-binding domain-containing protein [Kofleriaceae bacterium]
MDIDKTIGFLGGGNMAEALIRGLVRGGHIAPERVRVSGPRAERLGELGSAYGVVTTRDNRELARQSQILVLSVKPQILDRVLLEVAGDIGPGALVISLAAGVPSAAIEARLPGGARVVRAMPNTPALVG